MGKHSKTKRTKGSKAALIGISSLISLGSVSVAAGCYLGLSSTANKINVNDNPDHDNTIPGESFPELPSLPPDDGYHDVVSPSPQKPPVSPDTNNGGSSPQENVTPQPEENNHGNGEQNDQPQVNPDNGNGNTDGNTNTPHEPDPIPPAPQPPVVMPDDNGPKMEFTIDVTRTSGFPFKNVIPQFDIFDAKTDQKIIAQVDDYVDNNDDGFIKIKLPEDGSYKIKVASGPGIEGFNRTTYNYPTEVTFDKSTPNVKFQFEPVIEEYKVGETFTKDDVSRELWVTEDVLGQPISIRENSKAGKMTVLMYMRTTCPKSIATLNSLNKAIFWPSYGDITVKNEEIKKHVEVICFSDYAGDTKEVLQEFQRKEYPDFHFVKDDSATLLHSYFPNNSGYPKTVILDYQGVFITRFGGRVENQSSFETYIPKFSLNGVTNEKEKH